MPDDALIFFVVAQLVINLVMMLIISKLCSDVQSIFSILLDNALKKYIEMSKEKK